MKKIFCTIAVAMFTCSAFAQQKIEATYVEAGVNENDPSTYTAKKVVMPDGKKETMLFKKKQFNQDNVKNQFFLRNSPFNRRHDICNREKEKATRVCEGNVRRRRIVLYAFHQV